MLDIATGTGEVALEVAQRYSGVRVTAIDYSRRMLAEARHKLRLLPTEARRRVSLHLGDMRATGMEDSIADVVTNTFALRNISDRAPVLGEFLRLLKPGGRLFILEPGIPRAPFLRFLHGAYLSHVMPFLGNVLSRTDYAYSYLKHSIESFPEPGRFLEELRAAGFVRARALRLSFGIAVLYSAARAENV